MSISESMAKTWAEEDQLRKEWALGDYVGECLNCGRYRLCECSNGKHRCEKCNWVPEDQEYRII